MKGLRVILDANFLMAPENFGIDIFDELDRVITKKYELVVPEAVVEELEKIGRRKSGAESRAARVALELSKNIETVPTDGKADEEIVKLAEKWDCAVATNDSGLQKELRERDVPVIYLRQESYLDIYGKI